MQIKPLDAIKEKWTTVTPGRTEYYKAGTAGKGGAWEAGAKAAEGNFKASMTTVVATGAYGKGVGKAGGSAYERGVSEKGVARWPQGVSVGGDNYAAGFGPFHSALASLKLPPRGPKGDPRNYDRVRAVGSTLRAKKVAG